MADIEQLADGRCSFDVVITCRNADMELITNTINQISTEFFNDFELLVDERVTGFMMFGVPAKYHYTIKGTDNQISDFRHCFQAPEVAG